MPERSAGILLYRTNPAGDRAGDAAGAGDADVQVWLGHMGGPFWQRRPRAWGIPKGLLEPGEDEREAALREFAEEIGTPAPPADYRRLGEFRQSSGKVVVAFAGRADFAVDEVRSNTFSMEWPRGSGVIREYPEIDEARWFPLADAREAIVAGQLSMLAALEASLASPSR
ncbi:NUDIX domain-containing protein [Microbacteriaceae bacterium 4G12]